MSTLRAITSIDHICTTAEMTKLIPETRVGITYKNRSTQKR